MKAEAEAAEAGLKLTASKTLLATLCNAHFTCALRGAHSLAHSITCTQAHGKVAFDNKLNESKRECIANRLTDQPTN